MDRVSVLLAVVIISFVQNNGVNFGVNARSLTLEAEDMTIRHGEIKHRDSASSRQSIYLHQGNTLLYQFCLSSSNTSFQVEAVGYSNDGGSDHIQVSLDNEVLGIFKTIEYSHHGQGWTNFRDSTLNFGTYTLTEGTHVLSVKVLIADTYGVELDYVRFRIGDDQSLKDLRCNVFCFDEITYKDSMMYPVITTEQAVAKQRSVRTGCAEEDNVNIPVYHDTASKYVVTASLPRYSSFENNRKADWNNCPMATSVWKFKNVTLQNHMHIYDGNTMLGFTEGLTHEPKDKIGAIRVGFELKGPKVGSTDSEIGWNVHLKNIVVRGTLSLKFKLYGRGNDWSHEQTAEVTGSKHEIIFTVPDFSFEEGRGQNAILIDFYGNKQTADYISIGEIYMFKRHIKKDVSNEIYNDGVTIIDAVDMDMWWRINETMTIRLSDSQQTRHIADFIRIYRKVPWSDGYSQVFVLYQDGNVRLLPITPHGLDWIPFGSSFLIGQSDANFVRPCSPIMRLEIDPVLLNVKIFFNDGGFTFFQIKTSLLETQLVITDSTYTRDLKLFPFFTFRSMWVSDGNGDADHVTTDDGTTVKIMGEWTSIRGNFLAFYRKCISKHNTLSPDIRLKVIA